MSVAVILLVLLVLMAVTRRRAFDVYSAKVVAFAHAIAFAEGYFTPGSLPQRSNNPGALKGPDGKIRQFANPDEGWAALYRQVEAMLSGRSLFYRPDMTIRQIAQIYTGGDNPEGWAQTVSGWLGVSPDTPLEMV